MGFTFIKGPRKDEFGATIITIELLNDDLTYDELIDNFTDFLRACGYVFEGEFELINPLLDKE